MLRTRNARFVAAFTGAAFAIASFAPVASAATVAELQAQINALMAQLSSMSGGSSASATFNADLTLGSKGADVTALQNWLISKGQSIPAGATGYFGAQTKAAVMAWQAASGISPAAGYFGPKSRAAANAGGASTTGGTTSTTSTGSAGITTPGAEGILSVTTGPVPNNTVYAGDHQDGVLVFQAKALSSDIALQRVQVDLGTNTTIYNKIFSTLYVVDDAGRVLASTPLNSTTVSKSGSNYFVTITGFSSVVPKNMTRNYTVAADLYPSIDTTYRTSYTVGIQANGIRGVDGAGIDLYAGAGGPLPTAETLSNTILVSANLTDSAAMTFSTNSATPLLQEVIAADGASLNQKDKVAMLVFDVRATSDDVTITDLTTTTTVSGGVASASSTYLYAGNGTSGTLINSATAVTATGVATFSTINQVVPKNTTKTFTIAADIRGATSARTTFGVSVTSITAQSSTGTTVVPTGSATSNSFYVRNIGPVFTLVGTPSIMKSLTAGGVSGYSTSTLSSTFVVNIQALGSAISFPTQAASSTFGTRLYQGGAVDVQAVSSTTSFIIPSNGIVTTGLPGNMAFQLAQNNSVQVTVNVYTEGRITAGGAQVTGASYAVGLDNIIWSSDAGFTQNVSNFMRGKTNWQTASVQLP